MSQHAEDQLVDGHAAAFREAEHAGQPIRLIGRDEEAEGAIARGVSRMTVTCAASGVGLRAFTCIKVTRTPSSWPWRKAGPSSVARCLKRRALVDGWLGKRLLREDQLVPLGNA
jgi:hypothetical protein